MEGIRVRLLLDEYMKEHGVSKNRLSKLAKLQRTQLNSYCRNEVTRLDLSVLTRICDALGCDISDILKYKKGDEGE